MGHNILSVSEITTLCEMFQIASNGEYTVNVVIVNDECTMNN